jgi:hypothetical protein
MRQPNRSPPPTCAGSAPRLESLSRISRSIHRLLFRTGLVCSQKKEAPDRSVCCLATGVHEQRLPSSNPSSPYRRSFQAISCLAARSDEGFSRPTRRKAFSRIPSLSSRAGQTHDENLTHQHAFPVVRPQAPDAPAVFSSATGPAKPVGSSSTPIATLVCLRFLKGPAAIRLSDRREWNRLSDLLLKRGKGGVRPRARPEKVGCIFGRRRSISAVPDWR